MLPVGFEPTIPASERPENKTLDRAATGIGKAVFVMRMCLVVRLLLVLCFCYTNLAKKKLLLKYRL